MQFTHDTESALITMQDLANTLVRGDELLDGPADLERFLDTHEFSGRRDDTVREVAEVRGLRAELRALWHADGDDLVGAVNELLERTGATPRLVRHDGWDWHLHVTRPDAALVDRLGAEAAMTLLDLVRGDNLHRLRICAGDDCDAVLVDLSRNSSRRYCDTANCANRAHVAAHRARKRGARAERESAGSRA